MRSLLIATTLFALLSVAVCAQDRYPIEDSRQKETILAARVREAHADEDRKRCVELGNEAIRDNRCYTTYPLATMIWGKGFYEGLAKITVRGKSGFINSKGVVVIKPDLRDAGHFSDGLAPFEDQNGKWGFIDSLGKVVIKPQFDLALSFREGLAAVQIGTKWGFIGRDGEIKIEAKFETVSSFAEGLAEVTWFDESLATTDNPKGKRCSSFIDSHGNFKLEGRFDSISRNFDGGIALVNRSVPCPNNNCLETYAIDKNGVRLWTLDSWYVSWIEDDAIVVAAGEDSDGHTLYCAIGRDGKRLFEERFSQIGGFSEGLAPARKTWEGKYGFINKHGEFLIEDRFSSARSFSEGLAAVEVGSLYGYIDKNGNIVIPPQFEFAGQFQSGFALVAPSGKGKDRTGYIDRNGKVIWQPTK